jgi:hypothetical protein
MPQRGFCFVVVLLLFFSVKSFSQRTARVYPKYGIDSVHLILKKGLGNFQDRGFQTGYNLWRDDSLKKVRQLSKIPLEKNFYARNLSFFCRQELKLEKTISIPFRFRLGSVEYVDYLEKKPNAIRLH